MGGPCPKPDSGGFGPSFYLILVCPPPEWIYLVTIGFVCLVVICYFVIKTSRRFTEVRWTHGTLVRLTRIVVSFYIIYAIIALFTILNPRGTQINVFLSTLYDTAVFMVFYQLIWAYAGGYEVVLPLLNRQTKVCLGVPPLCCLRPIYVHLTKKFFRLNELFILQLPTLQVLLGLYEVNVFIAGDTTIFAAPGNGTAMEIRTSLLHFSTTVTVVKTLSVVLAMYGIGVLFGIWRDLTNNKRIAGKFAVFKATQILGRMQLSIFSFVEQYVPAYGAMSGQYRVITWNYFLIILECLLFAGIASRLYTLGDVTERADYSPEVLKLENAVFSEPTQLNEDQSVGQDEDHEDRRAEAPAEMSFDHTDIMCYRREESYRLMTGEEGENNSTPSVVVTVAEDE